MKNKEFDLIVFDWDGTLMDSAARIVNSLRGAAEAVGLPVHSDAAMRNIIGLGMLEAVLALYPGLGAKDIDRFIYAYRHHFLVACTTPSPLFDGVHEMLSTLDRPDLFLGVATGKSRAGLDRVLRDTNTYGFFHATRTADETCSKPDPQMLREIIEDLGVEPARTLMVGDTEYDLEMAARAGAASLAVSYGAHEAHRFDKHGPLACVHSIDEMSQWLNARLGMQ